MTGSRYAKGTSVAVDRSIAEIGRIVKQHGATEFGYHESGAEAIVGFVIDKYRVELAIKLPPLDQFKHTPSGRTRTIRQAIENRDQDVRRLWRVLKEVVKMRCVAIEEGVLTFEEAWLAHLVLGDGRTVGHTMLPMLQKAKDRGALPSSLRMSSGARLLPAPAGPAEDTH